MVLRAEFESQEIKEVLESRINRNLPFEYIIKKPPCSSFEKADVTLILYRVLQPLGYRVHYLQLH